jgi:hypothetical protein
MIVGNRDPNQNRAFQGRYMVAEPLQPDDPYPTDDAEDGRFCLVGDNLDALAAEAIWALDLDYLETRMTLGPQNPLTLTDARLVLSDWRSESDGADAAPLPASISVTEYRIDLKLDDGRSIWIEAEDGKLRIHAYTIEDRHDGPINVDVLSDGFDLAADDIPEISGGNLARSIRFPPAAETENTTEPVG